MGRLLFAPFSIAAGLIAALVGKKIFEGMWGLVDDSEPPDSEHREVSWAKLAVALALEGAIFRVIRGITDRGARIGYERFTGEWPGEEEPDTT
jgi:Protein of unknown function (DUF4235)